MQRTSIVIGGVLVLAVLALFVGASAATKSYQFTGTVKTADGSSFTVEKSAKETWTFDKAPELKEMPKVGDKVTVYYKMVATQVEGKAAPAATPKKK